MKYVHILANGSSEQDAFWERSNFSNAIRAAEARANTGGPASWLHRLKEKRNLKTDSVVALLKHEMHELLAIRDPQKVHDWEPTAEEREKYVGLARSILRYDLKIKRENNSLIAEGAKVQQLSADTLRYLKHDVALRIGHIEKALQRLDPSDPLEKTKRGELKVRDALEVGLGYILAEEDPRDLDSWLPSIDAALEDLFRPDRTEWTLIDFDPDAWIERMRDLKAIRVADNGARIPNEVTHRLGEVNRAYVLGSWLSVIALARSVLEYALHDRAPAFNIKTRIPNRPRKKDGRALGALIYDFRPHFKSTWEMDRIRESGNDYLHASQLYADEFSRHRVLSDNELQERARTQLELLWFVLEDLYAR